MDLQSLLEPASDPAPCGPDLEYDPAFMALESEVQGKPEREIAGKIIEAVAPEWPRVKDAALALLARSKDLRVAMHLLRALTCTEHLRGFAAGVGLIADLVDRYWADLHPVLEHDNGDDPTARMNALAALEAPQGVAGVETVLRDLRDAQIAAGAQGRVTVRDVLVAEGKLPPSGEVTPMAALLDRLQVAVAQDAELGAVPEKAAASLTRLRDLLADKAGSARAPDVSAALDMLNTVARVMRRVTGATPDGAVNPQPASAGDNANTPMIAGELRGRDDVSRAIDRICEYLERTEPGNPAPLLMRRAQRLLNKNFVDLIADLAPESLSQIKAVAGIREE